MNGPDAGFAARMQRVDQLIRELEESRDPVGRERARELVRALLDLHAVGLARMVEAVRGDRAVLDAWARDPEVASLLLLHGAHPTPFAARVQGALDGVAGTLRGMNARAGVAEIRGESVRLRLEVGAGGVASAPRAAVEEAITAAAPEAVLAVEVVEAEAIPQAFIPVGQLVVRRS